MPLNKINANEEGDIHESDINIVSKCIEMEEKRPSGGQGPGNIGSALSNV